jgi:glucosamine-6-phosphate deaminase
MLVELIVRDAPTAVGQAVAEIIIDQTRLGRVKVLGIATGSSPSPLYRSLASASANSLAELEAFALDEYVGVPYSNPASYHAVIDAEVTRPLGLDPARVHVPDGIAEDLEAAAEEYEESIIKAGGVDLQILGIGSNGHIGFNEPGSSFSSRTRVVALNDRTRIDNARFFDALSDVPTLALTQGISTIMAARRIVLIANGKEKADAIAKAIQGPVDDRVPASILQTHPNVTFAIDRAAASALTIGANF